MGFTSRCAKCDANVREGARRCPLCGTPLSAEAFEAPPVEEGPPIIDPLISLFDRDEPVRTCAACRNEFSWKVRRCGPCGMDVTVVPRSRYAADLCHRPIHDRGRHVAAGPVVVPRDLVRVATCASPAEALKRKEEFRLMAVGVWLGSDDLDPQPDPDIIGLWVRGADAPAARYLLSGAPPAIDELAAPPKVVDPRTRTLALARAYFDLRKFRMTVALLEPLTGDAAADDLISESLLRGGSVREAERRAIAAAERARAAGASVGRPLMRAGIVAALGHDASPFGTGADLPRARARLTESVAAEPRSLDAGKALVEVLVQLDELAAAHAELLRMRRINANLLAHASWFRERFEDLRRPS